MSVRKDLSAVAATKCTENRIGALRYHVLQESFGAMCYRNPSVPCVTGILRCHMLQESFGTMCHRNPSVPCVTGILRCHMWQESLGAMCYRNPSVRCVTGILRCHVLRILATFILMRVRNTCAWIPHFLQPGWTVVPFSWGLSKTIIRYKSNQSRFIKNCIDYKEHRNILRATYTWSTNDLYTCHQDFVRWC